MYLVYFLPNSLHSFWHLPLTSFCTVPNLNQTSGVSYFCLMLESLYSRISRGGGDDLGIQNLSVLLVMALNSYSLGIHAISSLV